MSGAPISYLTVQPPSEGKILLTVSGNHGGPHANSPEQFELRALLDQDWQKGTASYRYYNGQRWIEVDNVPVVLELKRIQPLANVDLTAELHNATVEAVIATGDVAQIKHLTSGAGPGPRLDQKPGRQGRQESLSRQGESACPSDFFIPA